MTLPRLAGLLVAGVTGCFAVLFGVYAALVFIFARPTRFPVPGAKRILSLWRSAMPLFVFNAAWLVYLTANRWIAAFLAPPEELGFFAFGANLAFVGLGIVSTIAQVYYPSCSRGLSSKPGDRSRTFELQASSITLLGRGRRLGDPARHRLDRRVFPSLSRGWRIDGRVGYFLSSASACHMAHPTAYRHLGFPRSVTPLACLSPHTRRWWRP